MKKLLLTACIAAAPFYITTALADEPGADHATAGTMVKDSIITTKIKSKLAARHLSTLTNIKVDTDAQGVVYLSGKAPSRDASDLAEQLAKNTEGVMSVHNDIAVMQ
jgi:hyperosmotically inducible protein